MPGGNYRSGGIFNPRPTVYGLLDPQTLPDGTTYRMSTGHATLTFPYMAHQGRYADLSLRMASLRSSGEPPATVTVRLNGRRYPPFEVSPVFAVYTFTLDTRQAPNPYLDPAHIQLDIESTTAVLPDGTEAGVAVDSMELATRRDLRDVLILTIAWVVSLLAVGLVALRRFPTEWAALYMGATMLTLAVTSFTYTARPFPPAYEALLVGLAWFIAALLAPVGKPAWGLVLALLGLWVALGGRLLNDWQMDDAYISYRYASNLAHGAGLVYNPGEAPVEGYTNFLWTLVSALFIALGYHPGGVMLAAIVACSLGTLGLTYLLASRLFSGAIYSVVPALICALLLAVDPGFITYGVKGSGIEAVPFGFLALLSVALLWWREVNTSRPYLLAGGVTLALASLMRPEGIGAALILVAVKLWQSPRSPDSLWRTLAAIAVPYLLILVPYQAWRILFYGYPFPNTFYAKTGTSAAFLARGWDYTWAFAVDHWLVVALVLIGLLLLIVKRQVVPAIISAMYVLVACYLLYIVAVGGDHFPGGRFFVPLLAPLALLAVFSLERLAGYLERTQRLKPLLAGVAILGVVAYAISALWLQAPDGALARRTNRDTNFVNIWGSMGLWLRDHTPPDTLAASPVAGAIAFYGQRNVVDMLGINDLHIAHKPIDTMGSGLAGHEKEDPEYVLDRQPAYILPYPNYFDPLEERFASEYMTTTVRGPLGWPIEWWVRRP